MGTATIRRGYTFFVGAQRSSGESMTSDEPRPPTVFISYSRESQEHGERMLALADRLNADGIDCMLDQYIDSPPEGWQTWMDRQI